MKKLFMLFVNIIAEARAGITKYKRSNKIQGR